MDKATSGQHLNRKWTHSNTSPLVNALQCAADVIASSKQKKSICIFKSCKSMQIVVKISKNKHYSQVFTIGACTFMDTRGRCYLCGALRYKTVFVFVFFAFLPLLADSKYLRFERRTTSLKSLLASMQNTIEGLTNSTSNSLRPHWTNPPAGSPPGSNQFWATNSSWLHLLMLDLHCPVWLNHHIWSYALLDAYSVDIFCELHKHKLACVNCRGRWIASVDVFFSPKKFFASEGFSTPQ